ncbi:hypothetical protein B0H11DRAFT_2244174 [Mycena galericulata]|nr:hypothetical protein B0H11DRAFT_2244174 [Mycena galericulata]
MTGIASPAKGEAASAASPRLLPRSHPVLARALTDPSSSVSSEPSDLTPTSSSVAASGSATALGSTESLKLPTAEDPLDSLALLTRARTFQSMEQALYAQLLSTPVSALNDMWRAFLLAGRAAENRLRAWQTKHRVSAGSDGRARGSIIAFTMRKDYDRELGSMSLVRGSPSTAPVLTLANITNRIIVRRQLHVQAFHLIDTSTT